MEELIKSLESVSTTRTIHKRTILYYQGEIPRGAAVVRSGLLKVYSINGAGEEQIVAFHGPGDLFPLPWIFGETSNTLFYYEAVLDSTITSLPKDVLLEAIKKDTEYFHQLFNHLMHIHTGLLLRITALEQTRATEKILFTLYYLMFHYGKEVEPGVFRINLKLTQPAIASLVGLTRETTAKSLNRLKRRGIVNYKTYTYTINKARLERHLGEDSFTDLLSSSSLPSS